MSDPQTWITELIEADYSEGRIASLVNEEDGTLGVAQSTIHRIGAGEQSCRWELGKALEAVRNRELGRRTSNSKARTPARAEKRA